jgi:predicted TIM-barrel fold metal-dependent hydrolase
MAEIIDFNVHLGTSIQGHALQVTPLIAEMDRLAIQRCVLSPVRPLAYAYGPANDEVSRARDAHSSRFYGFGRVDARLPDAAAEAERCLGSLRLDGLFLHPWEDTISAADHRYDPVLEVCSHRGVPVLIATGHPMVAEALPVWRAQASRPAYLAGRSIPCARLAPTRAL